MMLLFIWVLVLVVGAVEKYPREIFRELRASSAADAKVAARAENWTQALHDLWRVRVQLRRLEGLCLTLPMQREALRALAQSLVQLSGLRKNFLTAHWRVVALEGSLVTPALELRTSGPCLNARAYVPRSNSGVFLEHVLLEASGRALAGLRIAKNEVGDRPYSWSYFLPRRILPP